MLFRSNPLMQDPFYRRFFGAPETQPRERQTGSLGSGVIIDAAAGYVVTNQHVIGNADEITVRLHDGRSVQAEVIGSDPNADIAVIKIPAQGLTAIHLGNSDRLRVGDFVVAIGNPFGLGQTVTLGIVSALGRSGLGIEDYEDFIQTDASINQGNSGGALVNLRGELIGVNTAIVGPGSVGIGFAIPINMVLALTRQIVEFGEVDDVLDRPSHPYTSGLIGSIPSRNQRGQRLQQISGMTPSLLNLPVGCAFRSRCAYEQEVCAVAPEVSGGDDGRRRLRCHRPLLGGGLSQESL